MKRRIALGFLVLLFGSGTATGLAATETSYPPLIGKPRSVEIGPDMTLMELAVREGVGFQALQNANPLLDPWRPVTGQPIQVPTQAIFPGPVTQGLTINLAELRVYFLNDQEDGVPAVYPLGIGRQGWETPEGNFEVIQKVENPVWRVPPGIKKENPELPDFIPAGPRNPLGSYWLGLSAPGYGLHGTTRPYGVGRRVSHGCIRLYDADIETLFREVPLGTKVRIVYEPVKATIVGNDLYLEVHPDFEQRFQDLFQQALHRISALYWPGEVDYAKVKRVVAEQRGIPVPVSTLQTEPGT